MMQAGAIARFGGITAYGDKFHGEGFHFTDVEGWTDAPDVDMDRVKRPAAHGRFVLPAWLDERVVRMPGFCVARTHMELEHASARFRGLITRPTRLVIEDALGTAWVAGTVTGAVFRNHGFAPEGTWSLEVTCEDPRKYGHVNEFPAGTVFHRGNFPALPVMVVTGVMPSGYAITGPDGKQFVVSQALAAGQTHRIDFTTGRLYRNDVLQVGAVSNGSTWVIPVGVGVTVNLVPVSGTGVLTVRVPDTFV